MKTTEIHQHRTARAGIALRVSRCQVLKRLTVALLGGAVELDNIKIGTHGMPAGRKLCPASMYHCV